MKEKDAARYRWLRERWFAGIIGEEHFAYLAGHWPVTSEPPELDAAIDAEIAKEGKGMTSAVEPLRDPLGDSHHTDVPFTYEDEAIGRRMAHSMGTLFADVEEIGNPNCRYWYYERTSVDEWRRVARALRVHGLKIVKAT